MINPNNPTAVARNEKDGAAKYDRPELEQSHLAAGRADYDFECVGTAAWHC
jgi:hypothetical protein